MQVGGVEVIYVPDADDVVGDIGDSRVCSTSTVLVPLSLPLVNP